MNLSGKTRGEYRSFLLQYTITWEMLEHMTKVVDHGVPDENVLIPLRSTAPELKECFIRLAWEYSSNMNISDAALPDILKHDIPGLIKIFDYILIGNVEEKKPDGLKPLLAIRTVSKLVLDLDSLVNLLRISSRMESQYDYKDLDAGVITDFRHENFSSIFDNSLIHQHAFLRKLQKIGELFTNKNLSKSTKDLDSSTDWEIFVNIRDAITHQDEGSNKYNVRKLLGWSKDKIKEVIEQIEQGFFARIIRLIWTRDQTLPTKFYATDFDDGENNAVEFWQAHYQQILDKSTEDSHDPQKMRVSGEELKLFIATLREQLPSQEEVFFQFWQDLLDGSSDTPNKQVLGKMFKPIADLKATHAEKVSVLKGIKDKALTKPTISKADRKSQRDTEDVDKVKRAQEDEEGLYYKGLEKIQELRDLLKNSTGTVINNLGRLESAIESLNNIKRFLEQHEFIRENFDYRSLQEWEEAHADKQKVLQFFATMIADPELRDAIEYNAGQLLQNLESLNFPVWFGGNLLSDDFYEPLRLLRNYIEHGNHIIDARPYIPGRSADILDYKSQIIGPAMMKLIIEFLPKLEMESIHQDLYVSFSSASEAEPYMVLGYLEVSALI